MESLKVLSVCPTNVISLEAGAMRVTVNMA